MNNSIRPSKPIKILRTYSTRLTIAALVKELADKKDIDRGTLIEELVIAEASKSKFKQRPEINRILKLYYDGK